MRILPLLFAATCACTLSNYPKSTGVPAHVEPPPPVVTTAATVVHDTTLAPITFEKGQVKLTDEQKASLDKVAATIIENYVAPDTMIRVRGYAAGDASSRNEDGRLALQRAENVIDYLVSRKVPSDTFLSESMLTLPVRVYGTSWCGPCQELAKYLKKNHVLFIDKDIEKDIDARREMRDVLSASHTKHGFVPVILIGETVLRGFDPEEVRQAVDDYYSLNRKVEFIPYVDEP